MRSAELKARWESLRGQLQRLEGVGGFSESDRVRLALELDRLDQSFHTHRRRSIEAPLLQDVVLMPHPRYFTHSQAHDLEVAG